MPADRLDDYLQQTRALKAQYAGQIELYVGLEVDFVPGQVRPGQAGPCLAGPSLVGPATYRDRLDYTIGSVHYVGLDAHGQPWEIDGSQAVFLDGLTNVHRGDIEAVIRLYYGLIRQMVGQDPPDIVGHLDKIKIQNPGGVLWDEAASWYREELIETLDAIAASGCMVEINTRGLYKKNLTTYPGPNSLPLLRERNIPMVINSDSHHPTEITLGFPQAAQALRDAGYQTVRALLDNQWQDIAL